MPKKLSITLALAFAFALILCACSNSEYADYSNSSDYTIITANDDDVIESSNQNTESSSSSKELSSSTNIKEYLPIDDSEYPYAGIPRIVIETAKHQAIKDRETEIPAKLQIWGEKRPESEVMELTIRGRGNTSWGMPQKSYKIEFLQKQEILGMPKDRDWALVSNYADKTLMKNYLIYHLSVTLGAFYSPRCEFVELFLNNEYLGIYLLSETIKIGKNRINIPENDYSYLVEVAENYRKKDQIIRSHVIKSDSAGKPFHVHSPKNASAETLLSIQNDIESFEKHLKTIEDGKNNDIAQWLDINEYIKYYWIQEFSKNPDASSWSSIYFFGEKGDKIKMGPVWDFDLSLGGYDKEYIYQPENWHIKKGYWHSYILKDSVVKRIQTDFWKENRAVFVETINKSDTIYSRLQKASVNNFKKWKILQSTSLMYHRRAYNSYKDAIEDLKEWIQKRVEWIDKELSSSSIENSI